MLERRRLPQIDERSDIFRLRMIILIALCIFALTGVAMAEPVAKIGDVEYNSLDDAFSVVTNNGGTLTILQDAPWNDAITIKNEVVIEGNNRIISAGSNARISVSGTGSLTMNETVFDGGTSEISGSKESFIQITESGRVLFQNSIIQNRNIGGINEFGAVFYIFGSEASLIMANSKIINCKVGLSLSSEGVGAIGIGYYGGHLTINGGEISNCGTTLESGPYYGGAIVAFPFLSKGYISISDTVIKNNHSVYGGGIVLAYDCDFSINNVSFEENISAKDGGALYIEGSSEYNLLPSGSVEGCLLDDNSGRYGGGLYINTCNISVKDCILSNNDAVIGGGLFNDNSAISFSGKNTICNNAASSYGADIFNKKGSITLPSASAMNETFHDKRFIIDGWYDDTQGNRWSEDGTGNEYLGDTYTITEEKGIIAAYTLYDEIQVTKTWEDENDAIGKRPNSLTFTLTDLSGTPVKLRTYDAASKTWIPGSEDAKITLNASDFSGNVWTGTIGPLLLNDYSDSNKYRLSESETGNLYKLKSINVDKSSLKPGTYLASFTNSIVYTPVSITIQWEDSDTQSRPQKLKIRLMIESAPQQEIRDIFGKKEFELSADNNWSTTVFLPSGNYDKLMAVEGDITDYGYQLKRKERSDSEGTIVLTLVNSRAFTISETLPDTGDNSNLLYWIGLAFIGAVGIIILLKRRKRNS